MEWGRYGGMALVCSVPWEIQLEWAASTAGETGKAVGKDQSSSSWTGFQVAKKANGTKAVSGTE